MACGDQTVQDDQQRGERADQRATVAEHGDRPVKPPELESVVQGEPEAVRPVKQHEDEQAQKDQPGEPMADHGVQMVVVGLDPAQGMASPKSTIRMGRNTDATTPPPLNNNHTIGSKCRLVIGAPTRR